MLSMYILTYIHTISLGFVLDAVGVSDIRLTYVHNINLYLQAHNLYIISIWGQQYQFVHNIHLYLQGHITQQKWNNAEMNVNLFSAGGVEGKSKLFYLVHAKRRWIYLFNIARNFPPSSSIFPRYFLTNFNISSFFLCLFREKRYSRDYGM